MFILGFVVEPAWSDTCIRLTRHPRVTILQTVVQHGPRHLTVVVQQTPVCLANIACLRTYPAQVTTVTAIVPDDSLGLQFTNHAKRLGPLVIRLPVDASRLVCAAIPSVATVGAIEPYLENIAIISQQLTQLVTEIGHIFGFAIVFMISIPRRKVNCKLQPLLTAGVCQLLHHVSPALLPWCVLHRILGIFRGPHTEATMMLSCEDNTFHASLFAHPCPLTAVKVRGIKQFQVLITISPLLIRIGIKRIVNKSIHLHLLPPQLVLRRQRRTQCLCMRWKRDKKEGSDKC